MATLDERDDALEAGAVRTLAAEPVAVPDVHLVVLAVQQGVAGALRQRPPGGVHGEPELLRQGRHQPREVLGRPLRPRRDGALRQRQVVVRHQQVGVDLEAGADAGALGAGAERAS